MLNLTGERYIPEMEPGIIHSEHQHRYEFAKEFVKDKAVLDLACGEGYGSFLLAGSAKKVFGVDIAEETIKHASLKYQKNNLEFIRGSMTSIPIDGEKIFDIIVCFEAIEHIKEQEQLMREIKRLLKEDGILIISTPNIYVYSQKPGYNVFQNPFHLKEMSYEEFDELLKNNFKEVFIYGQKVNPISNIFPVSNSGNLTEITEYYLEKQPNACEEKNEFPPVVSENKEAVYFIALASNGLISGLKLGSYLVDISGFSFKKKDYDVDFYKNALEEKEKEITKLREEKYSLGKTTQEKNFQLDQLRATAADNELRATQSAKELYNIKKSISWKFSQNLEKIIFYFLPKESNLRNFYKNLIRNLQNHFEKSKIIVKKIAEEGDYQLWIEKNEPKSEDSSGLCKEAKSLAYKPLISIIMPTYNIDEVYLRAAIESARRQFYSNWELCIADDGSTKPDVKKVLEEYRQKDKRIKIIYLEQNQGISGASNAALSLASGEFIGLLDCDDELANWTLSEMAKSLNQNPKLDFIYSDEDKLDTEGIRSEPFFKPDFSPDLLLSMNYITHFCVFRRETVNRLGGFRKGFDGSQDYDLIVRVTEFTKNIAHIPKILYHWRKIHSSLSCNAEAKPYAYPAAMKSLAEAIARRGYSGEITMLSHGLYKLRYDVKGNPFISIIIPTKDKTDFLRRCVDSILKKSTYSNYEIIIVDNESSETETKDYLKQIAGNLKCRVISFNQPFNYSSLNNFAALRASGDFLLFLNNDTEVITPGWLEEMLGHSQRSEVGAVGAKLLFLDNKIQHAGVVVGLHGLAGHAFYGLAASEPGYKRLNTVARNYSAVTGACMMIRRSVFEEIGGFDEKLDVAFNDVDLCLRIFQRGYYNVWTPHAVLYHYESATRGNYQPDHNVSYFKKKWGDFLKQGDPFYNRNLALDRDDFMIKI